MLIVEGRPVVEDVDKCGFRQLVVTGEGDVGLCFGPNGAAVIDVLETIRGATSQQLDELDAAGDAARDAAVYAAVYAAVDAAVDAAWDAAWDAARDAAVYAARDAAWGAAVGAALGAAVVAAAVADLVGQHGLEQHHIDTLTAPYTQVFGQPDWLKDT